MSLKSANKPAEYFSLFSEEEENKEARGREGDRGKERCRERERERESEKGVKREAERKIKFIMLDMFPCRSFTFWSTVELSNNFFALLRRAQTVQARPARTGGVGAEPPGF